MSAPRAKYGRLGPQAGICVSLALPDTASAIGAIASMPADIDVVEIRLDTMEEASIPELCRNSKLPLLFTNRPGWEGGRSDQPEEERLEPLLEAARHRTAYIDLELKASPEHRRQLLETLDTSSTRLIISHHDFVGTPESRELSAILSQQIDSGAHIGKLVTMAHNPLDVLRILHLQCEAHSHDFPLIAFCMGEAGKLSRAITLLLGGYMTYAVLDGEHATAPGQLTTEELIQLLAVLP